MGARSSSRSAASIRRHFSCARGSGRRRRCVTSALPCARISRASAKTFQIMPSSSSACCRSSASGNRKIFGRIRCRRFAIPPACPARRRPTCISTCSARPHGARSATRSPIWRRHCSSQRRACVVCLLVVGRSGRLSARRIHHPGHELDLKRFMAGLSPVHRYPGSTTRCMS